jgi:hypothetical protein
MNTTKIIGVYNELYYYIDKIVNDAPETIFKAGNSPFETQGYLPANEGMGLEKMRAVFSQTAKDFAAQEDAEFVGLKYEDYNPEAEPKTE